ncbi:MAG: glycosyltransferase family 2 protein [Candidatus Omnitrophota bacterium]
MKFNYTRHNLTLKEHGLERFFEIVPGALSWGIIIGMSVLSFYYPLMAAVIMIAFIFFWVMRLFYMNIFLIISYVRLKADSGTDWMERIRGIDDLDNYLRNFPVVKDMKGWGERLSCWLQRQHLEALQKSGSRPPRSTEIFHLVIIPVLREGREVVEPGIRGMVSGGFPAKRVFVVIALEEAAHDVVKEDMAAIRAQYRESFWDLKLVVHPGNLPGEARVKGANCTYAAKIAAKIFEQHKILTENIIVSCFDADTIATADYLSCLTYHFLMTPDRNRASYQPIPVYHNNIWQAPSFARVMDVGTSFFQMIEATNPRKLVTFSSHSMGFQALTEVGFWPVDVISDDSAIFWKALIHFDGHYRVVPMYTMVSMDIASGRNWHRTLVNIYRQKRRWAWGVENFPIVMRAFLKPSPMPWGQKFVHGLKLLDTFVSWATWSFLLTFVSWLPAVFASREFASSIVYYTAPRIKGTIFSLASVGVIVCMVLSLSLLPKEGKGWNVWRRVLHVFEWLFMPIFILVLSAFPALDAQTRLMFGKYLEFQASRSSRHH